MHQNYWSKCVTTEYVPTKTGQYLSDLPQFQQDPTSCEKYLKDIYSTQLLKNMLRCFSLDIIGSEKWTVFQEQSSRKIVCFLQLLISTDKYVSIFSHQIYSFLVGFCHSPGWGSNFLYKGNCACKWGLGETTPQRRQSYLMITGNDCT